MAVDAQALEEGLMLGIKAAATLARNVFNNSNMYSLHGTAPGF